jgi:hypothetical protein
MRSSSASHNTPHEAGDGEQDYPRSCDETLTSDGYGFYITIVTTNVMITVHDMQARRTYSDVWTDIISTSSSADTSGDRHRECRPEHRDRHGRHGMRPSDRVAADAEVNRVTAEQRLRSRFGVSPGIDGVR